MPKTPVSDAVLRQRILDETVNLYYECGLHFTMDQLAKNLGMSKKTIYLVFPDKEDLLMTMVDYIFDFIRDSKERVIQEDLPLPEKLRQVMGMLTDKYENADLAALYELRDRYPTVFTRVAERLESGWESTIALLEQGVQEGIFRQFQIPIFKLMMEATLEQFFQRDVLVRNGIPYREALDQVVDILLFGIMAPGPDSETAEQV